MRVFEPRTMDDFRGIEDDLPAIAEGRALFRGQTKDYVTESGQRSFASSIERSGCIPPLTLKWSFCTGQVLYAIRAGKMVPTADETLAVLQHYGWRSFFLDLTGSLPVAAWFAAYRYRNQPVFQMVEDCTGVSLVEIHRVASYDRSPEELGYVYVFDRNVLEQDVKLRLYDVESQLGGISPRATHQKAWAVMSTRWSEMSTRLNDALAAVIKAPVRLFAEIADEENLKQEYLFPASDKDRVVELLLSFPRVEIEIPKEGEQKPLFSAYRMSLDIPEYGEPFRKRHPPNIAYHRKRWLSDRIAASEFGSATEWRLPKYLRVDPSIFFGTWDLNDPGEGVAAFDLTRRLGDFVIEVDTLVPVFPDAASGEYVVGIRSRMVESFVELSSVFLGHPGTQIAGFGESYPRYYRVTSEGYLSEVSHPNSCPCNNHLKHQWLASVVKRVALTCASGSAEIVDEGGRLYLRHHPGMVGLPFLARRGYDKDTASSTKGTNEGIGGTG